MELLASVNGLVAQLLFNAEELVELRSAFTSGRSTSFLLAIRQNFTKRGMLELTICPQRRPTAMSAIVTSSVSPDR